MLHGCNTWSERGSPPCTLRAEGDRREPEAGGGEHRLHVPQGRFAAALPANGCAHARRRKEAVPQECGERAFLMPSGCLIGPRAACPSAPR